MRDLWLSHWHDMGLINPNISSIGFTNNTPQYWQQVIFDIVTTGGINTYPVGNSEDIPNIPNYLNVYYYYRVN